MSRQTILVAVIVILTAALSLSIGPRFGTVPRVKASTTNFTLYAYIQGWSYSSSGPSQPNPTITVTQGDTISFTLIDGYGDVYSPHLFLLDLDNTTATSDCPNTGPDKCSGNITPTQPSSIPAFIVTQTPGTYKYDCIYHYTTMIGKFVIKAPLPDFAIAASPTAIGPLNTRANGTSTITVAPTNGFSGTVTLSASSSAGLNATIYPSSILGASGTTTLTVNSTMAGSYSVTVTGTASSGTHYVTVPVTVVMPDFRIVLSPSSLTVASGSSGTVTVTATSLNGFSGTVGLTAAVPTGRGMATLSPPSVTLSSMATSATSSLTISSALGAFNTTVTATSGSTSHGIKVLVNGPDFTITSSTTSLSVTQGTSAALTITLSGFNGFSGTVSLEAASSSGGPPVAISPSSLQVPISGTISSTVTVTASSSGAYSTSVTTGSYTITVNATMGTLSHVETIPLTVTSTPLGVGFLMNPLVIGGIIGAVIIVGIALYVLSHRPKKQGK